MPAGWAAGIAAASAASQGVQASAGKKGAQAASEAQLAGLGDANKVIREAMAQYGPRVAGGNQGYRQMQHLYGYTPPGGDPDAPRALTEREQTRLQRFQKRLDAGGALSSKEQKEFKEIGALKKKKQAYAEDFDLASTVGKDEEQGLRDLEAEFGGVEEGIYGLQQAAQDAYTARNAGLDTDFGRESGALDMGFKSDVGGLDTRYASDVGGLDSEFKRETGTIDSQYLGEEKALRDKIAAGDITQDPGYKFRLEQGQLARERGAAARGGLLSGGHLKDLEEYSQGQASQEFGAGIGRLNDLYAMGKENYTQRRGNVVGDYERGRGYKTEDYTLGRGFKTGDYERSRGNLTGDYERTRGFGRQDYGDLRSFYAQDLGQRRGTFDRKYGQGQEQRGFALDRFGRRVGGAKELSGQGFDAMNQRSNLAGTLSSLYTQAGQAKGAGARAGYDALGQGVGGAVDDLSFLALLYGQGGFDGRGNRQYTGRQADLDELAALRGGGRARGDPYANLYGAA